MLDQLAQRLSLAAVLDTLTEAGVNYTIEDVWFQGEFHRDVILRIPRGYLPGDILIVAVDCNGGIHELMVLDQVPDRSSLWHRRCPHHPAFAGELPPVLAWIHTPIRLDPCSLLGEDAPSELLPQCRIQQDGGGWILSPTL